MKFRYLATLSLVAAALSGSAIHTFAAPPEPGDSEGKPPRAGFERPNDGVSPEDREKLRAAMQKAQSDPAVAAASQDQRAASQAYREALKSSILAKDPSMASLLEKTGRPPGPRSAPPAPSEGAESSTPPAPEGGRRGGRGPGGEGGRGGGGPRLSPEEREKLKAATEEAEKTPEVQAAAAKRDAANKAHRDALKAAILKENPTMEAAVDKMLERMKDRGNRMMDRGQRGLRRNGPPGAPPSVPPVAPPVEEAEPQQ